MNRSIDHAHTHIKEASLCDRAMQSLVVCFTEHFACSLSVPNNYIPQFLILKSDNIAKSNKIKDTSFNLVHL